MGAKSPRSLAAREAKAKALGYLDARARGLDTGLRCYSPKLEIGRDWRASLRSHLPQQAGGSVFRFAVLWIDRT